MRGDAMPFFIHTRESFMLGLVLVWFGALLAAAAQVAGVFFGFVGALLMGLYVTVAIRRGGL